MFKDYYDEFDKEGDKSLDPQKDRFYNLEKLNLLSAYYASLHGARADLKLNFAQEAQRVFNNQITYDQYRLTYVDEKLLPYLEGASEDNKLPKNKYNYLVKKKAESAGIFETEVQELLKRNGFTIGEPKGKTPDEKAESDREKAAWEREKKERERAERQKQKQHEEQLLKEREEKQKLEEELIIVKKGKRIPVWVLSVVVFIFVTIAGFVVYRIFTPDKQVVIEKSNIDLDQAIEWINVYPPEFSKTEEAVASLQANAGNPKAKEGLLKATEVYIGFGDNTASTAEKREYYNIAIKCNELANGNREEEIKRKIEELDMVFY